MYYDSLKRKVHTRAQARKGADGIRVPIESCIAECYLPIHAEIRNGTHSIFHLPGGRGSCKSSFASLEIVDGMMDDKEANAIIFRRFASTMRESVYTQIAWAIDELGVSDLWHGNVSPMSFTYLPTGQQILFRGLDDASKLKSIKPRKGVFRFVWIEEFSELQGENTVRSVMQSVMRGGSGFVVFNSFNPPLSLNSWANKYILKPDDRAIVFRTNYTMIPPEWLGESFLLEAERLKEINPDAYRHEYMGEAIGTGGEVFPNIEARTITDDEIKAMQYFYCGIDWGFASDPFAFVRCSYDRRTQTVFILDEIVKRGLSNADAVTLIQEKGYDTGVSKYQAHYDPDFHIRIAPESKQLIICDSAEPKSIADVRKAGLKAVPCHKYPGSVNYGIRWLQSKRIIIDQKRTPVSFAEFTQYEYEQTRDGEFLASVPDKDNHCIDGVRYALDQLIGSPKNSA